MLSRLSVIIIAIFASFINAPGPLYLKKVSLNKFDLKILFNKYLYYSAFFYLIGTSLTIFALQFGELSSIGPIFSLLYVWVTLLSIKLLNEKITLRIMVGILLVVIGIALVSI